jgi:hypothetical protein
MSDSLYDEIKETSLNWSMCRMGYAQRRMGYAQRRMELIVK